MKARFTAEANYVTVSYDCPITGNRTKREFMVPHNGGYVREGDGQVCVALSRRGPTLHCSSPAELLPMIRREYRKMQRASAF